MLSLDLQGATIVDQAVSISPQEDELTPSATSVPREQSFSNDGVFVLHFVGHKFVYL